MKLQSCLHLELFIQIWSADERYLDFETVFNQSVDTNLASILVWLGKVPLWEKCLCLTEFQNGNVHFAGSCKVPKSIPVQAPQSETQDDLTSNIFAITRPPNDLRSSISRITSPQNDSRSNTSSLTGPQNDLRSNISSIAAVQNDLRSSMSRITGSRNGLIFYCFQDPTSGKLTSSNISSITNSQFWAGAHHLLFYKHPNHLLR